MAGWFQPAINRRPTRAVVECTRAAPGFHTRARLPRSGTSASSRPRSTDPVSLTGRRDPSAAGGSAASAAEGGARWLNAAVWPVAICVGWAALAVRSPDVTYHLAPLAAASAWPAAARLAHQRPLPLRLAIAIVAGSLALTIATALLLAATGRLGGPSVWHGSGALETVLASIAGAGWGWRVATRTRPGLVGRLR